MESTIILLAILVAAVLGRANSVAVAAGLLLMVKLLDLDRHVLPVVARIVSRA